MMGDFLRKFERKTISIDHIRDPIEAGLYVRDKMNEDTVKSIIDTVENIIEDQKKRQGVSTYGPSEYWRDVGTPIIGLFEGSYYPVDGWHRIVAYKKLSKMYPETFNPDIELSVYFKEYATKADFILDAAIPNTRHGSNLSAQERKSAFRKFVADLFLGNKIENYYDAMQVVQEYYRKFGLATVRNAMEAIQHILDQLWNREVANIKSRLDNIYAKYEAGEISKDRFQEEIEAFSMEYLDSVGSTKLANIIRDKLDAIIAEWLNDKIREEEHIEEEELEFDKTATSASAGASSSSFDEQTYFSVRAPENKTTEARAETINAEEATDEAEAVKKELDKIGATDIAKANFVETVLRGILNAAKSLRQKFENGEIDMEDVLDKSDGLLYYLNEIDESLVIIREYIEGVYEEE